MVENEVEKVKWQDGHCAVPLFPNNLKCKLVYNPVHFTFDRNVAINYWKVWLFNLIQSKRIAMSCKSFHPTAQCPKSRPSIDEQSKSKHLKGRLGPRVSNSFGSHPLGRLSVTVLKYKQLESNMRQRFILFWLQCPQLFTFHMAISQEKWDEEIILHDTDGHCQCQEHAMLIAIPCLMNLSMTTQWQFKNAKN